MINKYVMQINNSYTTFILVEIKINYYQTICINN